MSLGSETAANGTDAAKTAIIYLRVSTARQANKDGEAEGYSIPAQRAACIKKARDLGAAVIEEYVDAGASARSADRAGLQRMLVRLGDLSLPSVDFVIVHKLDRLARDRADDVAILLDIRKAGATLVSVSEQIDETPAGTLMHGIVASFAEFYSKNLSTEAKKGLEEKVRRGGTPGVAPIGYLNTTRRIDGTEVKSVIVDESRAPHIQWAFAQYATGEWSITALRDALEERGLKTRDTLKYRGQPLSRAQVHRMLTQPYYKGLIRFKGMLFDGKHEPLVDEVTWQSVQEILAGRRIAGDRSWRHSHYLKSGGNLRCARCGGKIGYGWSRGKGGKYDYFFCLGRHTGRTSCDLPYLPAAAVEHKITSIWSHIRFSAKTLADIETQAVADFEVLLGQQEKLATEQRTRLIQLERQKSKLIDAYMADALPVEDLKLRQTQVATEIADARRLIAEADIERTELRNRLQIVLALLRKARKTYDTASDKTRQLLNTAMFERFELDSRDAGPAANGWTPQEPLVERAKLTEVVDAVLNYHPDAVLSAGPLAGPTASSTEPLLTSADAAKPSGNSGVPRDTTCAPATTSFSGLGRFRRTKPGDAHTTTPGRQRDITATARRGRHERTPAELSFTGGSNKSHLAVAEGFEPPDGFSRLSLSRRVH
ncbi:recombinase family protein [Mycobacterium riyadhense]